MSEFFFVVKTILITALMIAFLQVRVGQDRLEGQVEAFIRTSTIGNYVSDAAQGLVEFSRRGVEKIQGLYSEKKSKAVKSLEPGRRDPIPNIMKRNRNGDEFVSGDE